MSTIYSGSSFRPDVREVLFGREGGAGWKLDVFGHDPNWSDPNGDAWEQSLDEILPHLARFVDSSSTWTVYSSGEPVTFWAVISGHVYSCGSLTRSTSTFRPFPRIGSRPVADLTE